MSISQILITFLGFISILISGLWLRKSGKPYNMAVLTVHKLISVGVVIFIFIIIYQLYKSALLNALEFVLSLVMFLAFLGAVITGGLLSTNKPMPSFVTVIHKMSSFASILLTAVLIILLKERIY
jgi:hypothetical protein